LGAHVIKELAGRLQRRGQGNGKPRVGTGTLEGTGLHRLQCMAGWRVTV
jgi:hypothetical protein